MVALSVGAGGALTVALVAIAVFTSGSTPDPDVVADSATTTSTAVTTTTIAPAPLSLTPTILSGPPLQIRVDDPAQPAGAGTHQCVLVTMHRPGPRQPGEFAVAEGFSCAPGLSTAGTADVPVHSTTSDPAVGPVEIGCAVFTERDPSEAVLSTDTQRGVTTFTVDVVGVPDGEYVMTVEAVSGIGDGCAPAMPGTERENTATTSGTVTLR